MRTQQPCRIKSNRIERAQVPLKKKPKQTSDNRDRKQQNRTLKTSTKIR